MSAPITITAEPVEPIDLTLVDKKYTITPPKSAYAMKIAVLAKTHQDDPEKMADILDGWINRAFGDKAEKVKARLDDEKDLLDITHIMALIEKVIEVQMDGDPTT